MIGGGEGSTAVPSVGTVETRILDKKDGDLADATTPLNEIAQEPPPTASQANVEKEATKTEIIQDSSPVGLADEIDSPLDISKFLSFEEWKKQNLEKVGQSPENVGQGRPQGNEGRRRPINNALDTLGEEGEIELDFSGFGDTNSRYTQETTADTTKTADAAAAKDSDHATPARPRSKDAGKTCKERFNYASFDCAATVLKTNNKCKSSSSVLVENKDSYMLNECSSDNKFIIIELCDDILVDTVVVANFEFFSSMFRTFRISVSDRYPVKLDRWKDLGTFEARNSRDIQAFLIENPLIWARYVKIEFLTQYGSEFYCPVSLVRVHGTTMMEEFRHQEDIATGDDDDEVELVADVEPVAPVSGVTTSSHQTVASSATELDSKPVSHDTGIQNLGDVSTKESSQEATVELPNTSVVASNVTSSTTWLSESSSQPESATATVNATSVLSSAASEPTHSEIVHSTQTSSISETSPCASHAGAEKSAVQVSTSTTATTSLHVSSVSTNTTQMSASGSSNNSAQSSVKASEAKGSLSATTTSASQVSKASSSESIKVAPPPAQPSTQDSFFKQTNKRLNMLETNSSLNIQYIEEQSRILRDAFVQTEKHQLKKTETFLNHLNETVMSELKGFRTQYDQLWQSTVIELEESRARSQREMMAFSSRLTMLADELVWAKRMNVVQSILLLASLGLFVFASRGKDYMDMPLMQQAFKRSQSVLRISGHGSFDSSSPPASPESMRAFGPEFRRSLRETQGVSNSDGGDSRPASHLSEDVEFVGPLNQTSDHIAAPTTPIDKLGRHPDLSFEPPTPEASIDGHSIRDRSTSPTLSPEEAAEAIARGGAQSSPATPSGTRENQPLNWIDEVSRSATTGQLSPGDAHALSSLLHLSERERILLDGRTVSQPSPLRHSTIHEAGNDEFDDEDEDTQNDLPEAEGDMGASDHLDGGHDVVEDPTISINGIRNGDAYHDLNGSPLTGKHEHG